MFRPGRQLELSFAALLLCALPASLCAPPAAAQNIQFPRSPAATTVGPATPSTGIISAPAPGASTPINPYTGGSFSPAPFDPYSSNGASAYQFWSTTPPSNTTGAFSQPGTPPVVTQPGSFPTYGPPATTPGGAAPQYVFPPGTGTGETFDFSQSLRLIQDVRFRETWLAGGDAPTDLDINDIETGVTFTWPNFLTSNQPLYISPAFALHLWDGPAGIPADLPSKAYSAYLDFQYATDPALQIGAELGVRVGVYTDFNTLNTDSLRIQGLALGVARLTPTVTFKFGVMYLDRNDIKLLPAGGILWTPTPQVRFDIFFPQPRLSAYLMTVGRYEVWWYLAGEYGGGAWTIERTDGTTDRIDINDIRFSGGLEWTGPQGFTAFIEVGYVFEREVFYVVDPTDTFEPPDTVMLRTGFSW